VLEALAAQRTMALPIFPRVEVRGTGVFIIEEDGRESYWSQEESEAEATEVANEIQLELRAIKYVRLSISKFISDLAEELIEFNIPTENLDKVIYEGCFGIQKFLMKLSSM